MKKCNSLHSEVKAICGCFFTEMWEFWPFSVFALSNYFWMLPTRWKIKNQQKPSCYMRIFSYKMVCSHTLSKLWRTASIFAPLQAVVYLLAKPKPVECLVSTDSWLTKQWKFPIIFRSWLTNWIIFQPINCFLFASVYLKSKRFIYRGFSLDKDSEAEATSVFIGPCDIQPYC